MLWMVGTTFNIHEVNMNLASENITFVIYTRDTFDLFENLLSNLVSSKIIPVDVAFTMI